MTFQKDSTKTLFAVAAWELLRQETLAGPITIIITTSGKGLAMRLANTGTQRGDHCFESNCYTSFSLPVARYSSLSGDSVFGTREHCWEAGSALKKRELHMLTRLLNI